MTVIYNMSIDRADKPWIGDRWFTEPEPVGEGLLLAGPLQYVKCQSEKFQNFSEHF